MAQCCGSVPRLSRPWMFPRACQLNTFSAAVPSLCRWAMVTRPHTSDKAAACCRSGFRWLMFPQQLVIKPSSIAFDKYSIPQQWFGNEPGHAICMHRAIEHCKLYWLYSGFSPKAIPGCSIVFIAFLCQPNQAELHISAHVRAVRHVKKATKNNKRQLSSLRGFFNVPPHCIT